MRPDDFEANQEVMYWAMAKSFGFTPKQVNKMPYDTIHNFQALNKKYNQEQEQKMKQEGS